VITQQGSYGSKARELSRQPFAKSSVPDYRQTQQVRPVHAAEAVTGSGLLAYGAPRLVGQLGKHPPRPKALVELTDAVAHASWPESVTEVARAVPPALRPAAATLIGAALLHASHPITVPREVRSKR
jgi:hypothetical protein